MFDPILDLLEIELDLPSPELEPLELDLLGLDPELEMLELELDPPLECEELLLCSTISSSSSINSFEH